MSSIHGHIDRMSFGAALFLAACAASALAQSSTLLPHVQVTRGRSQMTDVHWAHLVVAGRNAIRVFPGRVVSPRLELECLQGDDESIAQHYGEGHLHLILFNAGPADPEYYSGLIRLDEDKAESITLLPLSTPGSYDIGTEEMIQKILRSKTVRVQFVPFLAGRVIVTFDVRGFAAAFARQPECTSPTVNLNPPE